MALVSDLQDVPRRGEGLLWNGGIWKVEELDENSVGLRQVETGERATLSRAEWLSGIQTGLLERQARPRPLVGRTPRRNAFMRFDDANWRVRVIRSGIIHLENARTDEGRTLSVTAWQERCFAGKLEMVAAPDAQLPERVRELLAIPLSSMPNKMRCRGEHSALFLEAYRTPEAFYRDHMPDLPETGWCRPYRLSAKRLIPFLDHVARAHGVNRPGFSTFCKWLGRVEAAGGDVRAAVPRFDRQGPQQRYMPGLVEQWLHDAIDTIWLTSRCNPKGKVHEELESKVDAWNKEHPDAPLTCPSVGHVARYIRETVDKRVAKSRRRGRAAAEREFEMNGDGPVTTFVLERVEMDHTPSRLPVRDDRTGVRLGEPWVTVALDHYSRMPLALCVQFQGQSLAANFQAMRMVMTPKGFLKRLVPELDYDYPAGVPVGFYFDRGADYDTDHVWRVGQTLHIRIDYAPVKCPEFKGSIERFFRTLKEEVCYPLPGSRRRRDPRDIEADSDRTAYITLSEFVRRTWHWLTMIYAKRYHRGIDDIPLARWQRSHAKTLPRALRPEQDLNVLLTRVEQCEPTVNGVTWNGLTWTGTAIQRIITNPAWRKGDKVSVRIDDWDLAKAWVIDPFTARDMPLDPVMKGYMAGLTLHQHDLIVKSEGKRGRITERHLVAAKQRMREVELGFMDDKRRVKPGDLAAVARHRDGRGPSGDDLGNVLPHPAAADGVPPPDAAREPVRPEAPTPETARPPAPEVRRVRTRQR